MPFMAGASRMRYWRFFIYNALGCILWASVFALLGYFFGESWNLLEKWIGRAGAVIGSLLLLIIALGWFYRWIVRHETELRRLWQTFIEQPRAAAFRRRFAPQIKFLQDRLTPGRYLRLHLTVGALIVVLACWWFGGIVEDLLTDDPLVVIDKQLALWLHQHATDALTRIAEIITFFGSTRFLTIASVATALLLLWRRYWYRFLTLVLVMGGGGLLNPVLKSVFRRSRPVFENLERVLSSYSFPSGHTMGSTLFYGLAAVLLVTFLKEWRWRVLAFFFAFAAVLLIGLTRIYLGDHYLSDVMGGIAVGTAWLALCYTAVETLRRRRDKAQMTIRE